MGTKMNPNADYADFRWAIGDDVGDDHKIVIPMTTDASAFLVADYWGNDYRKGNPEFVEFWGDDDEIHVSNERWDAFLAAIAEQGFTIEED